MFEACDTDLLKYRNLLLADDRSIGKRKGEIHCLISVLNTNNIENCHCQIIFPKKEKQIKTCVSILNGLMLVSS